MITAYLGIGSNLNDPVVQVREAFEALAGLPATSLLRHSALYRSAPMGPANQPDYINAVASVQTSLSPHVLLAYLQAIEAAQGRTRSGERWDARTLDLDILLYGEQIINDADLQVPHPGLQQRNFVLYPLQEIAPQLVIPGLGELDALVAGCSTDGLERISPA